MSKVEELVAAFEDLTLPKEKWTHAAHLTVAMFYLLRHPREEATRRTRDGIRAYNAAVGTDPGAYHETITLAWIRIVAAFLRRHAGREVTQDALAAALTDTWARSGALLAFYTKERLFSPEARARWLEPDLAPIDDVV